MGAGTRSFDTPAPRRDLRRRFLDSVASAATTRDAVLAPGMGAGTRSYDTPAPRRRALGNQAGFTLIELLVVIIVLGLLVGLVGPQLWGRVSQSKTATARAQIELFGAALDQYRLDVGRYPDTAQGLASLWQNPNVPNWSGPYLKKPPPNDPWGAAYRYRCCPGQHGEYDLWTDGADAAPGGEGENIDVTSWGGAQK